MNKTNLKSYYANIGKHKKLINKVIPYEDNTCLISDSVSIIRLNDNYGLEELEDKVMGNYLVKYYDKFVYNYDFYTRLYDVLECTEEEYNFKDNWSINMKKLKKIVKLIKADVINIVRNENDYAEYVIHILNTKTNEHGYLLPCKKY